MTERRDFGEHRIVRPTFEALYRDHFGLVWSTITRAGVAPGAREDAMQEVWLTVHRRMPSYDATASAANWIAGIARHVVWRQLRATIRARRKIAALDRVAPDGLDDPIVSRERMRGIEGVLATLDPGQRDALVAVDIFGSTGPEAAQQLGLPLNTLYSRLRIARARVHAGLDALEQQPPLDAPRGLAERTWLLLAPSLGTASTTSTAVVVFGGALVATLAVAITTLAGTEPPRASTPLAPAGAVEDRVAVAAATPQPNAIAEPPAEVLTPVPSPVVAPTKRVAAEPDPIAPVETDEGMLLTRAMQSRRAGDYDAAIASLAEHERRFPNGTLAIERKVERVRALCAAGKAAQARGEATRLARAHPDSVAVATLGDGCEP